MVSPPEPWARVPPPSGVGRKSPEYVARAIRVPCICPYLSYSLLRGCISSTLQKQNPRLLLKGLRCLMPEVRTPRTGRQCW